MAKQGFLILILAAIVGGGWVVWKMFLSAERLDQQLAALPKFPKEGIWLTDFADAKKLAGEKGVPILVNFTGSDWCGWCMKLDGEVFSQPSFQKFATVNLVLLKIDRPMRKFISPDLKTQNSLLARKYGVRGYPTIVLLDYTGKEISRLGYVPGGPSAFVGQMMQSIKQSSYKAEVSKERAPVEAPPAPVVKTPPPAPAPEAVAPKPVTPSAPPPPAQVPVAQPAAPQVTPEPTKKELPENITIEGYEER